MSSLPAAPRDALFLDLLRGVDNLESASPQLLQAASQVAFVPSAAGKLAKACDLYDPSSAELRALLDPQTHFPSDDFKNPQAWLLPSQTHVPHSNSCLFNAADICEPLSHRQMQCRGLHVWPVYDHC